MSKDADQATDKPSSAVENVARLLCLWAEYHDGNWRLYTVKASEIVALCRRTERT